jgi:hypothetical protein
MRVGIQVRLAMSGLAALAGGIGVLTTSASAQDQTAMQRVIVVLKNQDQAQPATRSGVAARRSTLASLQSPIVSQMSAARAADVHAYTVIDAVSATVTSGEESALKSDPSVSEVIPDRVIQLASPQAASGASASAGTAPPPGACGPGIQLDPQALQTIGAASQTPGAKTARSLGLTGAGVTVGFIADGLDVNDPDFIRPNGQPVFSDYKDFSGQGTGVATGGGEAFLDASSIAAQGREVYDVSHYSDLPLNRPCRIRIQGVAPGVSLVGLDVFGAEDGGFNSSFLQAIDYAVTVDHVNVLNESLGNNYYPDDQASLDLIKQANDNAVAAGTTVTVSTGDAGVTSTIGTPATDPDVISAGASTTYRLDAQIGYGGARFPGVTGWLDNNISSLSSGGFEQDGRTLDLVAPGELNWALCSTDTALYADCVNYAGNPSPVEATGGTSESAPLTAGVAALVIQAYRIGHRGASPSPALVKQLIVSNTDDLGAPADQQGTGLLDAYKAALAAERYGTSTSSAFLPSDDELADSSTQLNAVDAPATPESFTDTLTNESGATEHLSLTTRAIGAEVPVKRATVTLSDADSQHVSDWQGYTDNVEPVTFTVPYGENRLSVSLAYQNAAYGSLASRVRLTLVDPNGKLASYDLPQGTGNYGNSQVTDPAAGTWTAYIYSRDTAGGGTTGPVYFGASVARYTTFGTVSPSSATLAPGQSVAVNMAVATPAAPGDSAGAIVVGATRGGLAPTQTTTIPVTLRSLIPSGTSSFTGVTTGGNGRGIVSGQTFYYQLNVPAGSPELNAVVTLANNPNYPFDAYLVDPAGEAQGYGTNSIAVGSSAFTYVQGAQVHVLAPQSGTWTLVVEYGPTASGQQLAEPFTIDTSQAAVPADGGGLPDSPSTQLAAGTPSTYDVTVKNTGSAPESFFIDARSPGTAQLTLASLTTATVTEPLTGTEEAPFYWVPTETSQLTESATTSGPQPIQFDSNWLQGDPDIGSSFGQTATASWAANPIASGTWELAPEEWGAFGASGAPTETVTTSAAVTAAPFDPAVTSGTGDLELAAVDPSVLGTVAPVTVDPGQTATIPVTVTPAGPSGTAVTGTLYIDDLSSTVLGRIPNPEAQQVAAIPYGYTIQ